jgi:hypothetical protein
MWMSDQEKMLLGFFPWNLSAGEASKTRETILFTFSLT